MKEYKPSHAHMFMSLSVYIFFLNIVLLMLRIFLNVYTLNPFYLICGILISLGLFLIAYPSRKE